MTCKRSIQNSCVSITAYLLLMIWTATNASAQTADDSAKQGDGQQAAAQAGDSSSDADEAEATIPSLDQILRIALEHNPDIRAARAEVAVAEANLDRTRLTVVKELTDFCERWHSMRASLTTALEELANTEKLAEKNVISGQQLRIARAKATGLQLQFRELETELPFLLGAPLEDVNQQAATSDVESQTRTDILKDKAIPLAEQGLALSSQSFANANIGLEQCLKWSTRLMRLQREVADSDAERDAAVERYLKQLQTLKEVAKFSYKAGTSRQEDVLAVELAIVEAQAMLGDAPAE